MKQKMQLADLPMPKLYDTKESYRDNVLSMAAFSKCEAGELNDLILDKWINFVQMNQLKEMKRTDKIVEK